MMSDNYKTPLTPKETATGIPNTIKQRNRINIISWYEMQIE